LTGALRAGNELQLQQPLLQSHSHAERHTTSVDLTQCRRFDNLCGE